MEPVVMELVVMEPVAVEVAFDDLAESLSGLAPPDAVADLTADWMHALLSLAADEMKRLPQPEEQVDASSIAA